MVNAVRGQVKRLKPMETLMVFTLRRHGAGAPASIRQIRAGLR